MKRFAWLMIVALLVMPILVSCTAVPAAPTAAPEAATEAAPAEGGAAVVWRGAGKPVEELSFGTVVKSSAFNWFKRMDVGVQQYAADTGINAFQQGPSQADAALQIQTTEDVIAQGVDALLVVPHQVKPMEPVLKKAMDQGILVITHEASDVENALYDVEPFDNAAYGRHLMDNLAKCMGEEGKYATFVGSLTTTAHNEWVDAAVAYQKEQYPKMEMVGDKNESGDSAEGAYERMKELLKTYPDIKGVQGSGALDVVGAGQAVQEAGLQDQICVVGTSIPSYAAELSKTGAIDSSSAWDPAMSGYAMNKIAQMVLNGEEITDGMDLGVPGYEKIKLLGKVIYGNAWIDFTNENMADYNF
jgi:simple sugar transport system substrate-binding protein